LGLWLCRSGKKLCKQTQEIMKWLDKIIFKIKVFFVELKNKRKK